MTVELSRDHQHRCSQAGDAGDRAQIVGTDSKSWVKLRQQERGHDRREGPEPDADAILHRGADVRIDCFQHDRVEAARLRTQQHRGAAERGTDHADAAARHPAP